MNNYTMNITAATAAKLVEDYNQKQKENNYNKVVEFISQELEPAIKLKAEEGIHQIPIRLPETIDKHIFINIIENNGFTILNGLYREITVYWPKEVK